MLLPARYDTNHDAYDRDTRTAITIDEQATRCNRVACTTCTLFKKVKNGRFINSFFLQYFFNMLNICVLQLCYTSRSFTHVRESI